LETIRFILANLPVIGQRALEHVMLVVAVAVAIVTGDRARLPPSTTLADFERAGFPNQFFNDSWVVGFWRGRPWLAGGWIGKKSLDVGSNRFWIGWVIKRGGKCARSTCQG
jgi:hypothetical protein